MSTCKSKSTPISHSWDLEDICGIKSPKSPSANGFSFQEILLNRVSCSAFSGADNDVSESPTHKVPEFSFSEAWKNFAAMDKGAPDNHNERAGRTRSRSFSRENTGAKRSHSEISYERQRRMRSRSHQPLNRIGSSQHSHSNRTETTPKARTESRTKLVTHLDDFVLPQYIGNQYGNNNELVGPAGQKIRTDHDDHSNSTSDNNNCTHHHIRCLPHGFNLTLLAIIMSWAGLGLSVLSRMSLNFVKLETPWHISAIYEEVTSLGIIHANICYNETITAIRDPTKVGCFNVPLATNDDIDDPIFKLAAAFISVSVLMGFMLTLFTTTSICWHTINFRAIGTGYLFLYCFQSLSFLYFDSDLCEIHGCRVDTGCLYCIFASLFWMGSCLLCAKMDSNRMHSELAEERKKRKKRAVKEAVKQRSMVHRSAGGTSTVMTERTLSCDDATVDLDEELFSPATPIELAKRHSHTSTGLARQYESIITLDPFRRYSTGNTTISALTPTSMDDTLKNRNRGRLEYQGDVMPNRGRSRSAARGRGASRSKSRTRSKSATARKRSKSRPKQPSNNRPTSNNAQYVRTAARVKEPKSTQRVKVRTVGVRTEPHNPNTRYTNIPLSPANAPVNVPYLQQGGGEQKGEETGYVTSFYDI